MSSSNVIETLYHYHNDLYMEILLNLQNFSMLENFPTYIKNVAEEDPFSISNELQKRQHYKPKGCPPFSADLIRYALRLRYTSRQAYKLLLEKFPLPSFSLSEKSKVVVWDQLQQ